MLSAFPGVTVQELQPTGRESTGFNPQGEVTRARKLDPSSPWPSERASCEFGEFGDLTASLYLGLPVEGLEVRVLYFVL